MSRKLPEQFELKIDKLANNGEGVGFLDGKEINVFGAFPGEIILAKPTTKKKKIWRAELLEVIKASKERRKEKESHYLSCGPWQTIDEKTQLEYKKEMVVNEFEKILGLNLPNPEIIESEAKYNYRNKMEFSFTEIDGELNLALHKRYRHGQYSELESCCLAEQKINEASKRNIKNKQLKNLLLRYSAKEDKCLVILFVVDREIELFEVSDESILGWQIIYSDPLSPATKTTEVLFKKNKDSIIENISDIDLKYYYDSFFQINPKAFEKIIKYLKDNIKDNKVLVDLYSGVGTIGLCLSEKFEEIHLVEFDEKASEISLENAKLNDIKNVKVYGGEAEKQDLIQFLSSSDTLIVDPPRSGMHPKAIKQIIDIAPENFVYVSCNPFTQLRDMQEFSQKYKILNWRLFDLYPQTPHLESVLILEKK
jgi:23S rRNA (uracil1939-C5)-methyltransferase